MFLNFCMNSRYVMIKKVYNANWRVMKMYIYLYKTNKIKLQKHFFMLSSCYTHIWSLRGSLLLVNAPKSWRFSVGTVDETYWFQTYCQVSSSPYSTPSLQASDIWFCKILWKEKSEFILGSNCLKNRKYFTVSTLHKWTSVSY